MMAARKFIDIAANLTDPMFQGIYYSKQKHTADLDKVLERAWKNGLQKIIITGTSLRDSEEALYLSKSDERLFCTVGCHPTSCNEFDLSGNPANYLAELKELAERNMNKVVAIGECGLDYDRLHFCPKETQLSFFEQQLELVESLRLPLFLHCRNAASDLLEILNRNRESLYGGVVHSFDGSKAVAEAIVELGYHIGINGCSLKTPENLLTVASIPVERLLIETDCPWCEVRRTHAGYEFITTKFPSSRLHTWRMGSMVKGRYEPSHIHQVLEILAVARDEDVNTLCNTLYENTEKLFFSKAN